MSEPSHLESQAKALRNALDGAVVRALRRQDAICVWTSGGLGSSVLAALLARHTEIPIQLIAVSAPKAPDAQRARALARHLELPLAEIVLTRDRVRQVLPRLVPWVGESLVEPELAAGWGVVPGARVVNPLRVAWELPLYLAAREAARHGPRLLVGQGADELLGGDAGLTPDELRLRMAGGLDRLEGEILPIEARIADEMGVRLQYPFLDARVKALCRSYLLDRLGNSGVRARVLRRVAERAGLPEEIVKVERTPAPDESGVLGILQELASAAGAPPHEFLAGFLSQRRSGEPHSFRT